jgi:NAD(P)-dependent dehydrogenase (short-subunit alcohol dehydrogenase family)
VVHLLEKAGRFVCSGLSVLLSAHCSNPSSTYRTAIATKCNVTNWDEQVEMFKLAVRKYGSVDIVVSTSYAIPNL